MQRVAVLLVALIAGQAAISSKSPLWPWMPQPQRQSEGETTAPEESSEEGTPSAFVSSTAVRSRRAAADEQVRFRQICTQSQMPASTRRIFHGPFPAHLAGRNGTGCPLRC